MFYLVLFMQKVLYDSYTLYVYSMNPSLFTVQGTQGLTEVDFWEKTIAARAPLFIMLPVVGTLWRRGTSTAGWRTRPSPSAPPTSTTSSALRMGTYCQLCLHWRPVLIVLELAPLTPRKI